MNKMCPDKDMFQVSYQNVENVSRNSYFKSAGPRSTPRPRTNILVCTFQPVAPPSGE